MRHRLTLAAVLALPFALSAARADVAPPPGYDEPCTLEKVQKPGQECKLCGTYYANPADYCGTQLGPGYVQACRTRGASVWSEIWCKPGADAPAVTATPSPAVTPSPATTAAPVASPAATPSTSAGAQPSSGGGCQLTTQAGTPWALLGVAAWALTRRRRRG